MVLERLEQREEKASIVARFIRMRYDSARNFHRDLTKGFAEKGIAIIQYVGSSGHSGCGMTCQSAMEGDTIALISGVSMPMILRARGKQFKVIGPVLLDDRDVMNGIMWNSLPPESLTELVLI
jgi:hypothetical protein